MPRLRDHWAFVPALMLAFVGGTVFVACLGVYNPEPFKVPWDEGFEKVYTVGCVRVFEVCRVMFEWTNEVLFKEISINVVGGFGVHSIRFASEFYKHKVKSAWEWTVSHNIIIVVFIYITVIIPAGLLIFTVVFLVFPIAATLFAVLVWIIACPLVWIFGILCYLATAVVALAGAIVGVSGGAGLGAFYLLLVALIYAACFLALFSLIATAGWVYKHTCRPRWHVPVLPPDWDHGAFFAGDEPAPVVPAGIDTSITEETLQVATSSFAARNIIFECDAEDQLRGFFGNIYRGSLPTSRGERVPCVIKVLHEPVPPLALELLLREEYLLNICSESNTIVQLFATLHTPRLHALVLRHDYFGNLRDALDHGVAEPLDSLEQILEVLPWHTRVLVLRDISQALAFLHMAGILHGDIRSENIYLCVPDEAINAPRCRLANFRAARFIGEDDVGVLPDYVGEAGYVDPESFETGLMTLASDVYSLGIVLAELMSSEPVVSRDGAPDMSQFIGLVFDERFQRDAPFEVFVDATAGWLDCEIAVHAGNSLLALDRRCLSFAASDRPTASALMEKARTVTDLVIEFINSLPPPPPPPQGRSPPPRPRRPPQTSPPEEEELPAPPALPAAPPPPPPPPVHDDCVICSISPRTHAFIPCGHRMVCRECSAAMQANGTRNCPICRAPFTSIIPIYL